MKLTLGIALALAATLVWQTSVLSREKAAESQNRAAQQIQSENQAAGRVPLDNTDCD